MNPSSNDRLRLGPLPKTETVKLTITLSTELKTNLERYAAEHSKLYGPVDAATLIPHMLDAFITRDRGFRKAIKAKAPHRPVAEPAQ